MLRSRSIRFLLLGFGLSAFASGASLAQGQHPSAPKLFPDNTLAYLRVDDTRDLRDRMRQTSMGRLGEDPEIKPIFKELYSGIVDIAQRMQEEVGVNLDELLSIPNGELALAVIPTKTVPAVCLLLEAGDELPPVEILLARLEDRLDDRGAVKQTKDLAGVKLISWMDPNREDRQAGYFIHSGCLVLSSRVEAAETLAKAWTGNATNFKPLSENKRFTTILSRCVGAAGERPQVSFFADPIAIVREVVKQNGNAAMVAAMLPVLGVDGIQGVGGSLIVRPDDFDSITHMHLLLASPRKNLMDVIRPKSGSTDPEDWVSDDVATYATFNWDLKKTLKAVEKIFDTFRGEGAFREEGIARANQVMGFDVEKEIVSQLNDRLSLVQIFIRPAKINSGSNLYSVHLKNGKDFDAETMPKIVKLLQRQDPRWETSSISGRNVHQLVMKDPSEAIRAPQICMAVVGNQLLLSDSRSAMERAIGTADGQHEPLIDSVEFKLVRDRIKSQLGDRETSIVSYSRPEESLRLFYDLAADPANKERLKGMSENNPFFAMLSKTLERHKLPSFDVIAKYLAPSGSFVYEDESGIHSTSFSMRREK